MKNRRSATRSRRSLSYEEGDALALQIVCKTDAEVLLLAGGNGCSGGSKGSRNAGIQSERREIRFFGVLYGSRSDDYRKVRELRRIRNFDRRGESDCGVGPGNVEVGRTADGRGKGNGLRDDDGRRLGRADKNRDHVGVAAAAATSYGQYQNYAETQPQPERRISSLHHHENPQYSIPAASAART